MGDAIVYQVFSGIPIHSVIKFLIVPEIKNSIFQKVDVNAPQG